MSKTLGNVIDPFQVIERSGADALRFYLLREVQWGQDGDVTWEGIQRRYEGELANDLGNLVSRSLAMVERYRDGVVPEGHERARAGARQRRRAAGRVRPDRRPRGDLGARPRRPTGSSRSAQPWALARSEEPADAQRLDETLYTLVDTVRSLAVLLHPSSRRPPRRSGRRRRARRDVCWDRAALGLTRAGHRGGAARAAVPRRSRGDRHPRASGDVRGDAGGAWSPRAAAAGVSRIATIGREQAVDLAERLTGVVAVVGFHPHEAGNAVDLEELRPLLGHPRVVALGECGLDYYRDYAPARRAAAAVRGADRAGPGGRAAAGDPHPRRRRRHVRDAGGRDRAGGAALLLDRRPAVETRWSATTTAPSPATSPTRRAPELRAAARVVPADRCWPRRTRRT